MVIGRISPFGDPSTGWLHSVCINRVGIAYISSRVTIDREGNGVGPGDLEVQAK